MKTNHLPVTVKIWSTIYHLLPDDGDDSTPAVFIGTDGEETPDVLLTSPEEKKDDDRTVKDTIHYEADGELIFDDEKITVTYSETEEVGMENCSTTLVFDPSDPQSVVMNRTGNASAVMIFSAAEPRQHCVYQTGVADFPLDLCIRSRHVRSEMTPNGGTLFLDYVFEMRGVITERTVLKMRIVPHANPDLF